MSLHTRADAADQTVEAVSQASQGDTGLGTATRSDIVALNRDNGATYIHNDSFQIADNSANPATMAGRLQEFVDSFGHLGKLYSDATNDNGRFEKFQERMQGVYGFDKDTFKAMGKIGDGLLAKPPMKPEEVGSKLADIFSDTLKRQGGQIDLTSPDWKNLESAMAGVMIAATSTFKPETRAAQTTAMVDAMESQLRKDNVPYVSAIIWGDTKEPGLAVVGKGQSLTPAQRHNFMG